MKRTIICFVFCLLTGFTTAVFAQKEKTVEAEYTYWGSSNESIDEAKRRCLQYAKQQAISRQFGEMVSQTNITHMENSESRSIDSFMSIGSAEAKGEWIETLSEPEYKVSYDGEILTVEVKVKGRIREVDAARIDFQAHVLKNGTEDKFASEHFRHGDDLYVSFISPTAGYLSIYLIDDTGHAFCLLPYMNQSTGIYPIRSNNRYVFFNTKEAEELVRPMVDEYNLTCDRDVELNEIYVIFSPNEFTKAVDNQVNVGLPRQLDAEDFHKWLAKCRRHDKKMTVKPFALKITNK